MGVGKVAKDHAEGKSSAYGCLVCCYCDEAIKDSQPAAAPVDSDCVYHRECLLKMLKEQEARKRD